MRLPPLMKTFLPSTAITAGMVHNIHRISIIGHLYRPDIQIKYVPKAIDSKGREGTDGPSPPIERSQIAAKTNSNLNQVWAKPKKGQTEGRTERRRNAATHCSAAWIPPVSCRTPTNNLTFMVNNRGFQIFELSMQPLATGTPHPLRSHFNSPRCQSPRGQSTLPYLAIIKCFWERVGHL